MRHAVDVIRRAVQGIDDPAVFGPNVGAGVAINLLAEQAMLGKGPQHDLPDRLLRGEIGLSDQIGGSLFADFDPADPILNHTSPSPRRLFAHSEIVVRGVHRTSLTAC